MKIIIIGAGELGQMLAKKLCSMDHDVIVIDNDANDLEQVRDKLDVLTIVGNATNVNVLKIAEPETVDLLLAVTGDPAVNMIACQIGRHLGVRQTICRMYSVDGFSTADGITPQFFGIDKAFSSPAECAHHVISVLPHKCILKLLEFSHPDAIIVALKLPENSPLNGLCLQDIPDASLLENIRFAAIIRNEQLIWPHGNTKILAKDKIYLAGHRDYVEKFMEYVDGEKGRKKRLIIITGATTLNQIIIKEALKNMMDVRIIEQDEAKCEELLSVLPQGVQAIHNNPTDEAALLEAGIAQCDAFIGATEDDENNILSCILAKHLGAQKAIVITHKPEYIDIVPAMNIIDCGFNSTVVSANTTLQLVSQRFVRFDSLLKSFLGYFNEFRIGPNSPLVGKPIREAKLPQEVILALLFRKEEVLIPTGTTVLEAGDSVVAIVTPESEKRLRPYLA